MLSDTYGTQLRVFPEPPPLRPVPLLLCARLHNASPKVGPDFQTSPFHLLLLCNIIYFLGSYLETLNSYPPTRLPYNQDLELLSRTLIASFSFRISFSDVSLLGSELRRYYQFFSLPP